VTYAAILGRVVRLHREMQGKSLDVIAKDLGFKSVSGWSRIETGDVTMNVNQLRAVSRCLGVKPASLVQAADDLADGLLP
jgi:transcriptional regulator with XRE-family HTH domain